MNNKKPSIYKDPSSTTRFFAVLLFAGLAHGFYQGVQENFLAEIVGISKFERGIVEFFRELPGLLLIFILATMYRFSEAKILKIGIAITLAGALGIFLVGTGKVVVVICMVIYSLGEHIIMPVKNTISMHIAKSGKSGASLGMTSAIDHAGRIVGFLGVTGLFLLFPKLGISPASVKSYKIIFLIATLLLATALIVVLRMKDGEVVVERRSRLYFSRKFAKYYGLEVFYGARKQIFLTFAPYVLILQYGASTSLVALLLAICALSGIIFAPLIGRLIDFFGYKIIMVSDTIILMVVCFFYGFSHRLFSFNVAFVIVCVNYVLDSIISLGSLASSVYVKDIASSSEEITATLTTGISVNHLISVLIALLGGYLWQVAGIEVIFSLSGILGLINTIFAATIKVEKRALSE